MSDGPRKDVRAGDRVIVYDRYHFAVPVKGTVEMISDKDGALQVWFDKDNPGGHNVNKHDGKWFHFQQCRWIDDSPIGLKIESTYPPPDPASVKLGPKVAGLDFDPNKLKKVANSKLNREFYQPHGRAKARAEYQREYNLQVSEAAERMAMGKPVFTADELAMKQEDFEEGGTLSHLAVGVGEAIAKAVEDMSPPVDKADVLHHSEDPRSDPLYDGKIGFIPFAYHLVPRNGLAKVAMVMRAGERSGRRDFEWMDVPVDEHINHAISHLVAFLSKRGEEHHLANAACRVLMALDLDETEVVPKPKYDGPDPPDPKKNCPVCGEGYCSHRTTYSDDRAYADSDGVDRGPDPEKEGDNTCDGCKDVNQCLRENVLEAESIRGLCGTDCPEYTIPGDCSCEKEDKEECLHTDVDPPKCGRCGKDALGEFECDCP